MKTTKKKLPKNITQLLLNFKDKEIILQSPKGECTCDEYFYVNLTGPWGAQTCGQMLLWVSVGVFLDKINT